jgi:hypothetical protein
MRNKSLEELTEELAKDLERFNALRTGGLRKYLEVTNKQALRPSQELVEGDIERIRSHSDA